MPLYHYRCKDCGHQFEKIQAYGEEPVTKCPECEGMLIRAISPPNFKFKGGKPSKARTHKVGKKEIPIHQTDEGHWEQDGIMDKR